MSAFADNCPLWTVRPAWDCAGGRLGHVRRQPIACDQPASSTVNGLQLMRLATGKVFQLAAWAGLAERKRHNLACSECQLGQLSATPLRGVFGHAIGRACASFPVSGMLTTVYKSAMTSEAAHSKRVVG